ncbi:DUF2147 domain-containing protein [Flavobacterium sp.]|uniref:DUF2147 domain-containing protein n=1 Tax=Flavobacterium sp. TaxID=239 RepID=UPI00261E3F24|nr:DUF2147 domain-containing protein [Flavobacterium sp.]
MSVSKLFTFLTWTLILAVDSMTAQNIAAVSDKVVGVYWSPKKDAKISIYKKGNVYFGKSIWVANPRKDTKNPEQRLQSRELLGIELLSGFIYDDGSYINGTIYDPESGNTYKCKMTIEGNKLKVRGYIGISLFGRTELFERINTKG